MNIVKKPSLCFTVGATPYLKASSLVYIKFDELFKYFQHFFAPRTKKLRIRDCKFSFLQLAYTDLSGLRQTKYVKQC